MWSRKKIRSVHRESYRVSRGDPTGKFVCHKCDTPACVNPDHLFLGTAKDNAGDKIAKGRHRLRSGELYTMGIPHPRVTYHKQAKMWHGYFTDLGKYHYVGLFKTSDEALKASQQAVEKFMATQPINP